MACWATPMPTGEANLFGLHEYDFKEKFFDGPPILSQVRIAYLQSCAAHNCLLPVI